MEMLKYATDQALMSHGTHGTLPPIVSDNTSGHNTRPSLPYALQCTQCPVTLVTHTAACSIIAMLKDIQYNTVNYSLVS